VSLVAHLKGSSARCREPQGRAFHHDKLKAAVSQGVFDPLLSAREDSAFRAAAAFDADGVRSRAGPEGAAGHDLSIPGSRGASVSAPVHSTRNIPAIVGILPRFASTEACCLIHAPFGR